MLWICAYLFRAKCAILAAERYGLANVTSGGGQVRVSRQRKELAKIRFRRSQKPELSCLSLSLADRDTKNQLAQRNFANTLAASVFTGYDCNRFIDIQRRCTTSNLSAITPFAQTLAQGEPCRRSFKRKSDCRQTVFALSSPVRC